MSGHDRRDDHSSEELETLAGALNALPSLDPPPDLLPGVMAAAHRTRATGGRVAGSAGRVAMRRKVLWGLAAAAGIVLAVVAYSGFPADGEGTEGAIGAAGRYQAGTASDLTPGDQAAQDFLKSDLFHRIMKDESVRKALSDPVFIRALADPALRAALADPAFGRALRSADFQEALRSKGFASALQSKPFSDLMRRRKPD